MSTKEYIKQYTHVIVDANLKEQFPEYDYKSVVTNNTNCYLTLVIDGKIADPSIIDVLAKEEITEVYSTFGGENPVANYGYSPNKQCWYGWSHRGMCPFKVGSQVKFGDVAYEGATKEDYEKSQLDFWAGENEQYLEDGHIEPLDDKKFWVAAKYTDDVPNEKLRGLYYTHLCYYPKTYGKGEWTAETLEDAKEMAMTYAKNIA